jgi:hypothetical protein
MTSLQVLKPHRIDAALIADATAQDSDGTHDGYAVIVRDCIAGWEAISGRSADPDDAHIVKLTRSSRVIRLSLVGPDSTDVIGKRRLPETLEAERVVLEQLGPALPVDMIRFYGSVERAGFMWHFLEDGGTVHFDSSAPMHVGALEQWILDVHRGVRGHRPEGLPDHSTDRYLVHLKETDGRLDLGLANVAADIEQRSRLLDVRGVLDEVVSNWATLVDIVSTLPDTLVHGDLQAKNILVRTVGHELNVLPIDWETSGWGTPAADIALLTRTPSGPAFLDRYRGTVLDNGVPRKALTRAATVGRIFRLLAAMDWASYDQLQWGSIRKPTKRLHSYGLGISQALQDAGIRSRPS